MADVFYAYVCVCHRMYITQTFVETAHCQGMSINRRYSAVGRQAVRCNILCFLGFPSEESPWRGCLQTALTTRRCLQWCAGLDLAVVFELTKLVSISHLLPPPNTHHYHNSRPPPPTERCEPRLISGSNRP